MNARALKILAAAKLLSLLLLLSLPVVAQAQYYYTNGLDIWSYTPNIGPATITGYRGSGVALAIPSTINGYPVTGIGITAFYDDTSLTSVTIPDSVTSIGDYAFEYCSRLSSISLGNGVTSLGVFVFAGCTSLTSVTIPDNVISIGEVAFEECTNLTSVTIGNSVTSIGASAFEQCSRLTSVTIPDSVTRLGDYAFADCTGLTGVTLGRSVSSLGESAFEGCSGLTSIAIPDSVTSIGDYAFDSCTNLTGVTIGNGMTSIGDYAFADCSSLTGITMGNGVTSLGEGAFYQCSSLTGVAIPDSVTSIEDIAFYDCSSLASAIIGNGVTSLGDSSFYECSSLTNVTIGSSVTSIGDNAFFLCDNLSNIAIPNSVTNIGEAAFIYCDYLTNMFIPAGVTSIGDGAFYDCFSLTAIDVDAANRNYSSVDGVLFNKNEDTLIQCPCSKVGDYAIPPSVTTIDSSAFNECFLLTKITVSDNVTSVGDFTFTYCSSLTSAIFGNGVPSIGQEAFYYCDSLTNVTIGRGVTSIGSDAFADCASLATVYFQGNSPTPTNDLTVFQDDATGIVYYQPGTTGWGPLFDGWPTMSNVVSSAIGSVASIHGNVTVTHMGGQPQPLNLNDPIQEGDLIETDKSGAVSIGFINNTDFNLSHNAKITIDEYVYDPNAQTGTFQIQHDQGSIWCKDGQIGNGCKIISGYGGTGIRGTEFIEYLDPCSSNEVVYLIEGELAITPQATGVTNIVDAPATIVFDASNFSTSALTQATYDAMLTQVNQTNETFASWQGQYFGCTNDPDAALNADPSGDGQDNYTKFLAGMNPTNSASYFHILSATHQGNDELVSWMCGGGRTNVLQTTTNLGESWSNVSPNIVLAGDGDSVTNYLDVGAVTNGPSRFYRVLLLP